MNFLLWGFLKNDKIPDKWVLNTGYAPNARVVMSSSRGLMGIWNVANRVPPKRMWDVDTGLPNRTSEGNSGLPVHAEYVGYTAVS